MIAYDDSTFINLLSDNNITVNGIVANMTESEILGFVKTFSNNEIRVKYNNILTNKNDKINVKPEQILELIYYSLNTIEQKEFLNRISNKEVRVSKSDEIILLSYNNSTQDNIIPNATTYNISSSRTAEIHMQEPITGTWGSLTMTLTGYFTRTIYDHYWQVTPTTEYDLDWTARPPVGYNGVITYFSDAYSNTNIQPYYGNEVWYQSDMSVFCYPNFSGLHIVVYPNSSYNYAYIG